MEERWLPVTGYEGLYEVSDHGRVRALDRRIRTWYGTRHSAGRVLKAKTDPKGYQSVQLQDSEGGRAICHALVHRLVLEAFVGPPPERTESRHLDGKPPNCRLDNLAWGTHTANMRDQYGHGTRIAGERHPLNKLTDEMCRYILSSPKSCNAIARELGVWNTAVWKVRKGETHTHIERPAVPVVYTAHRKVTAEMRAYISTSTKKRAELAAELGLSLKTITTVRQDELAKKTHVPPL